MLIVNSFQVPNELIDEYLDKLNGNDLKILLVIIRKTKGWNKEFDGISISQFQKLTGIKDERTIRKSIKKLIEFKLIERVENSGKFSLYRLIPPAKNDGGQKMSGVAKNAPTPPAKNVGTPPAKNAPHNNTLPKDTNTKKEKKETTLQELLDLVKEFHLENKLSFTGSKSMSYGNTLAKLKSNYPLEDIKEVIEYAMKDSYGKKILANPNSFFNNFESLKVALEDEKEKYPQPEYVLDFYDLRLPEGWVL